MRKITKQIGDIVIDVRPQQHLLNIDPSFTLDCETNIKYIPNVSEFSYITVHPSKHNKAIVYLIEWFTVDEVTIKLWYTCLRSKLKAILN